MSHRISTDYLVIGAGIAGLRAAVELARHGDVLVVTKESLGESNTHYAQGGIAVAMEGDTDVALHLSDTISAGNGIVYHPAAEALVNEGPMRVAELIEWGTQFDRHDGHLLRTREAAHSHPRILHANGDATGAEISRSLVAFARANPRIQFAEWTMATRLIVADHRIVGADLLDRHQLITRVSCRAVLIASGGAGQVYSDTTNPAVATGDGIALAAQAGAELADMEFYQFHPTALSLPNVPRFLLSEAFRGEGAWLINDRGERFMSRYHPQLELAPRVVVARAITREGMALNGVPRPVFLDMRHVTNLDLAQRFPGISRFLSHHGLDLHRDLIPVRPAAHYMMGGIRTDLDGRTNLRGLYAAGEAACTGVHGANRLASNSLLEGLVFGARAAQGMLADHLPQPAATAADEDTSPTNEIFPGLETIITQLRDGMWRYAGLLRDESSLRAGLTLCADLTAQLNALPQPNRVERRYLEAQSLAIVAQAILASALARNESRGAHFRNDYPERNDVDFHKHSTRHPDGSVTFTQWR